MPRKTGRLFFANPGPTNIPDSVLRALDRPTIDFHDDEFMQVYNACYDGLRRVLGTQHRLFMYTASGHGAWEATLVNLLSPGDVVLVPETGNFSEGWAAMARSFGLDVQYLQADWRRGAELSAISAALEADTAHRIKAICVVHNETSTGVALPLAQIRAALDAAKHPALFLVDTISSLGSLEFRMDEWGIDGVVGGSQKGLMLPVGFSFTGVSEKAFAAHKQAKSAKHYFDWSNMDGKRHRSFVGTVPANLFYGLREALRLIEEEGIENVWARHARLGEAVRRAIRAWAGNAGPQLFCTDPARVSNSVSAILMPEGHDAEAIRRTALDRFNLSLGGGLSRLGGKVFRIGHLGDLNEPMVLGTLGTVEMCLRLNGVPHGSGGAHAAMEYLAEAA
jgi:alanine-glyoxylate transaminase / serine-glyoxylate transaminase / serine-pyruvate transaminase